MAGPGHKNFLTHEFGSGRASPTGGWTKTEDPVSRFLAHILQKYSRSVAGISFAAYPAPVAGGSHAPCGIFTRRLQGSLYVILESSPYNFSHLWNVGHRQVLRPLAWEIVPVNTLRILLVDDHEAVRRGLRSLLSPRADWQVCAEAADGLEAVERARALRPNVVLMDISMPRM